MNLKHTSINIIILLFFFGLRCYSQTNYKHYTSTDGLPHDVTYNIIQDSKGYLWIGTDDGLTKFDGDDFKNYSLKDGLTSNYVTDIEELSNDEFAIATWGGGLHFLKNDSILKNLNFKDENLKIYDIKYHDDEIYTYTGVSSVVYNLKSTDFTSKVYLKKNKDFDTEIKPNDNLLKLNQVILNNKVYVHNKEFGKHNFKGISEFSSGFKLRESFPFLSEYIITSALNISNSSYIFGSKNRLIFTDNNTIKKEYLVSNIQPNEYIHKILKAPENKDEFVLVIENEQRQKRLVGVNIKNKSNTDFNKKLKLKTTISDAVFDFEGNLWITTFGDGIYCYYYSNPQIKNILEGEYIIDLIKHKNAIYGVTSSRLYEFENDSIFSNYNVNGFPKKLSIQNDKLTVLILNKSNNINLEFNTINGRFYNETPLGNVRQSDTLFVNDDILMVSNEVLVSSTEVVDNTINFYTNKGKWIYTPSSLTFKRDSLFESGLPSIKTNDFISKNGKTYLATDKGLVIKTKNGIKIYNETNGLQNERINCMLLNDNALYIGTQSGLSIIKNNEVYNFSKSFGIKSLAINKIIINNNYLWLAGNNGVSIVNLNDIKTSKPPKLNIKQEGYKFIYDVVSYQDRKAIVAQYKINNEDWLNLSKNQGVIDFNNFAPKDYSVKFRSQNSYSTWSYSQDFLFKIKTPWYKVWWIILLSVFCFLILAFYIFHKRLQSVSKRNAVLKYEIDKRILAEKELGEVRDSIARDFHDDLGNKLASISLMSDVLSKKVKSDASDVVKTIKSDADYLYKGTKDFIFSLQEKSNYLDEVQMYLTDFAEDYLYQFGIDFEAQSDIKENFKLPNYWSKQIIFIFKEAITNTVKHAEAKTAKMKFNFHNNEIFISYDDDGKGYDKETINANGINNMRSRAHNIGCVLEIQSRQSKGSQVVFKGKLPQ